MMIYTVEGNPVPWSRAGINGKRFYDKQKHLKLMMGISIRNQHANRPFYEGPIILDITFYMPIPSRVKDKLSWEGRPMPSKPDTSNLIKLIEDTAQGILYKDDAIIYKIVAERIYGQIPRTEFTIRQVNENN